MKTAEQILLEDSIKRIEIHLLALNLLSNEEPITIIEDEESHLSMINDHFKKLKTLEVMLWEDLGSIYKVGKAFKLDL